MNSNFYNIIDELKNTCDVWMHESIKHRLEIKLTHKSKFQQGEFNLYEEWLTQEDIEEYGYKLNSYVLRPNQVIEMLMCVSWTDDDQYRIHIQTKNKEKEWSDMIEIVRMDLDLLTDMRSYISYFKLFKL